VYVAGNEVSKATGKSVARIWKNEDVMQNLSDGNNDAQAHSIFISGSDIYVAGEEKNAQNKWVAKYWKINASQSLAQTLSNGTNDASAGSIFVSGSDVYVAGKDGAAAMLWTNSTPKTLAAQGQASCVVVK
jgi:hypothetical protein